MISVPETSDLLQKLRKAIAGLTEAQAYLLAKRLSAAFVAGYRGNSKMPISELQKNAIRKLSAEQMGYITEFNSAIGSQLTGKVKQLIADGKGYADIRREIIPYIEQTFGPSGTVTIDRTGQTRQIIEVDEAGNLHRVQKEITRPYSASVDQYSDMLSRTATHAAYEKGRAAGYQSIGVSKWRFIGPNDERARAWHVALLGKVFEYDTSESDMALAVLGEPNCRHRAVPFFDSKIDTPQSFFEKQKEKAGLEWKGGQWGFKESMSPY